jgi:ubiquinone/menaquinone biosynthesis C-methylase UbiE
MMTETSEINSERYFTHLVMAFIRGKLYLNDEYSHEQLIKIGLDAELRLHKFKRNTELPRVKRVLGALQAFSPDSLLDIGSGRGTFLWPMLDMFPTLNVSAIDTNPIRVADIEAVRRGGVQNLNGLLMDVSALKFEANSFDVVTALEVLEHLTDPLSAAKEIVRVARKFVIASVPSKEDDNPEHIQLFTQSSFEKLWLDAGARSVKTDFVLNHMIAVVKV